MSFRSTYVVFFTLLVWNGRVISLNSECQDSMPFMIANCTADTGGGIGNFEYTIDQNDRAFAEWTVCPRVETGTREWKIAMQDGNGHLIIDGVFCVNDTYNSSQICVDINGTLRLYHDLLPNNENGLLRVLFISSQLNTLINIRYGQPGVYPLNFVNEVEMNEGTLANMLFIVFCEEPSTNISVLYNGTDSNQRPVPDNRCTGLDSGVDGNVVQSVQISSVPRNATGIYTLKVICSGEVFESSITLKVNSTPAASVIPASASPHSNSSNSSSSISSSTDSDTPNSSTIVLISIGVGVFFLLAIMIILMIVGCMCYHLFIKKRKSLRKKERSSPDDMGTAITNMGTDGLNSKPKDISKPRLGSTSSERPLVMASSSSSDIPSNFTGVYCSEDHIDCGVQLKKKHGDIIHILDDWEDVRLALIQPNCTDILLFTDPSDEVFKEMMCCGIDPLRPDKRNKLRVIMFTAVDQIPTHNIGVNGYKFVFVQGSPDFDTLQMAITKAEYPELRNTSKDSRHVSQPTDERTVQLLDKLVKLQTANLDKQGQLILTQKEILEVNRNGTAVLENALVDTQEPESTII